MSAQWPSSLCLITCIAGQLTSSKTVPSTFERLRRLFRSMRKGKKFQWPFLSQPLVQVILQMPMATTCSLFCTALVRRLFLMLSFSCLYVSSFFTHLSHEALCHPSYPAVHMLSFVQNWIPAHLCDVATLSLADSLDIQAYAVTFSMSSYCQQL